jgi:hypothetical protein
MHRDPDRALSMFTTPPESRNGEETPRQFEPPFAPPAQPLPPDQHVPDNLATLPADYQANPPSGRFYITELLRRLHPNRHIAYSDYRMVTLMEMLRAFHVAYTVDAAGDTLYFVEQFEEATGWEPAVHVLSGTIRFAWKGYDYAVTSLPEWREAGRDENSHALYIAAETFEAIRVLTKDLRLFNPDRSEAILQYEGGWRESLELRRNLQNCTWDMLVLPDEIKDDIRENAERFFTGDKTVYKRLGLPHKRGFIFIGEPGDGKTLTGKIIANTYKVNFIYVTSLQHLHQTPSQCLREIYDRAHEEAPCVVLIEDLDSQIDKTSRTVFLNILDGFDHNDGILTIATTNNPADIDRALLDRPSRFDKKWIFPHPDLTYRAAYLTKRLRDVLASPRLSDALREAVEELAERTNHYSYAMLQELVVSAGFVYFANGGKGDLAQMLRDAYVKTQEQMKFGDPDKVTDIAKGRSGMGIRHGGSLRR